MAYSSHGFHTTLPAIATSLSAYQSNNSCSLRIFLAKPLLMRSTSFRAYSQRLLAAQRGLSTRGALPGGQRVFSGQFSAPPPDMAGAEQQAAEYQRLASEHARSQAGWAAWLR